MACGSAEVWPFSSPGYGKMILQGRVSDGQWQHELCAN